ncbi:MAG: hypothetical protein M1832_002154 [Thelocarpon impressellum]|nr:MAG: hypothetical protein M1832_002154 [Thelocarpon impressellum]
MGQSASTAQEEPLREHGGIAPPPNAVARTDAAGSADSTPRLAVIRHRRRYTWVDAGGSSRARRTRPPLSRGAASSSSASADYMEPLDAVPGVPDHVVRPPTPFDTREAVAAGTPTVDVETASSSGTRPSYLSRLGSRLVPRPFSSGAGEGSERRPEGRVGRRRLADRIGALRSPRHECLDEGHQFSTVTSTTSTPSSDASLVADESSSGPLPLGDQPGWSQQNLSTSTLTPDLSGSDQPSLTSASAFATPRASRLSRVRASLLQPLFHNISSRSSRLSGSTATSRRAQARGTFGERSDSFLPRLSPPDIGVHIDHSPMSPSLFGSGSRPFRSRSISNPDVRSPSIERQARRLQNTLRRGPSRPHRGEDQAAMLSRLLSVAAAATAASLVGNTDRAFSEAHEVAGDGVDGSFDSFLQALQNGSLAAALRNGGNEMGGGQDDSTGDGSFTPVNFFRMFRFGATGGEQGQRSGSTTPTDEGYSGSRSGSQQSDSEGEHADGSGARMVPVIIVGIRSVTPMEGIAQGEENATPPLFDALSNLPLTMPNGVPRGGSGTLMRRTDRRSRFARSRRASMSAVSYDSQRHQRTSQGPGRSLPDSRPLVGTTMPSVLSDSPPGPHPPPSTPADIALSAFPSGSSTPSRRPSSAASGSWLPMPPWRENLQAASSSADAGRSTESAATNPIASRRRRLSDSEFARHRDLGSGSSRRNGIVGDSDVNAGARRAASGAQGEGTRSWIIYVLGGSYPEDHPILTTPSLFTDSPTYEDMLLLASILGPAKPPVATHEDVASAEGVYRVGSSGSALVAERAGRDQIRIAPGERCLVCLCDYELEEDIRQLAKCAHLYHRDCIDEWLTTGRNSCPLCREQGVVESADQSKPTTEQPRRPSTSPVGASA